jgi:hypothetical protein
MGIYGHRSPVDHVGAAHAGRRLRPAELAEVAKSMGLPVSIDRYRPETMSAKIRRAQAYEEVKARALPSDTVLIKRRERAVRRKWGPRLAKPR